MHARGTFFFLKRVLKKDIVVVGRAKGFELERRDSDCSGKTLKTRCDGNDCMKGLRQNFEKISHPL
jgi:hypothetical protein